MSLFSGRLSRASLPSVARGVALPEYDPAKHRVGIVHIGIGGFHRAHQAVYTDGALAGHGGDWRIAGVSLRGDAVAEQLNPQDGLYAVNVRSAERSAYRVIGAIDRVLAAHRSPRAVLDSLVAPTAKIVSITVTEKGYCHDPATGDLNAAHPEIRADLAGPESPSTVLGFLAAALDERRARGLEPFTVLCCDNLPHNGAMLRELVVQFAELRDAALATWIGRHVAFPSTMVDRITPPTTDADLEAAQRALGLEDRGVVVTEPFSQWVIENAFGTERPRWEDAGAELVADVAPYELAKLRLLNGAHSALAYLGYLAGYAHVHEAMADDALARYVERLMRDEIAPTLTAPPAFDLERYQRELLARFRNPALNHRTWQIALDGSQKLPPRLLGTVRDRLAAAQPIDGLALAIAGWMRYVGGIDERGATIEVRDPLAAELRSLAQAHASDPIAVVRALAGVTQVFGTDLRERAEFVGAVGAALTELVRYGARTTLRRSLEA
ncbi:MAG TPA: mannitol dehydrogenase family protein [Gammaproteobacteria bacterium]|nr:mannitol dehydrogenase family protein [Gammaproteobacteria bacterium]